VYIFFRLEFYFILLLLKCYHIIKISKTLFKY